MPGAFSVTAEPGVIIRRVARVVRKRGAVWVTSLTVGCGFLLGKLIASPQGDVMTSVVISGAHLALIWTYPLEGLLVWLVAQPVTEFFFNIPLGKGVPDLTLSRFCAAVSCVLLVARGAIGKQRFPTLPRIEIAMLLFVPAYALSMAGTFNPIQNYQNLFDMYVIPFLVYFTVRNLVTDRRDVDRVLHVVLIIGFYTAVYAMYEQLTGNVLLFYYEDIRKEATVYTQDIRILRGLYGAATTFGLTLNMVIPIALYYFFRSSKRWAKNLYGALFVVLVIGVLIVYKRTYWIVFVLNLLFLQLFDPRMRKLFIVIALVFSLLIPLTWSSMSESGVMDRATDKWDSANGRTERWAEGIELWKQAPILGHGYLSYDRMASQEHVENQYLHILTSAGLLAFIPYISIFIFLLKDSIAIFRRLSEDTSLFVDREQIIAVWGVLLVFLVAAMTGSGLEGHPMAHLMFFSIFAAVVSAQTTMLSLSSQADSSSTKDGSRLEIAGGIRRDLGQCVREVKVPE